MDDFDPVRKSHEAYVGCAFLVTSQAAPPPITAGPPTQLVAVDEAIEPHRIVAGGKYEE